MFAAPFERLGIVSPPGCHSEVKRITPWPSSSWRKTVLSESYEVAAARSTFHSEATNSVIVEVAEFRWSR
jgi:hypothetical protein